MKTFEIAGKEYGTGKIVRKIVNAANSELACIIFEEDCNAVARVVVEKTNTK